MFNSYPAATLIAMTSARTIAFEYKLFEFIFEVVLEGAAGNGRTPNTTRISGVPHLINLMPFGGHD
jgi:hypothetical protein